MIANGRRAAASARTRILVERTEDSETALGSDIVSLALGGDALLKVAGKDQGLQALRKELSGRFNKSRTQEVVPPTT